MTPGPAVSCTLKKTLRGGLAPPALSKPELSSALEEEEEEEEEEEGLFKGGGGGGKEEDSVLKANAVN